MTYECRLSAITKMHVFGASVAVLVLFVVHQLGIADVEDWSAYAIGIVFALGLLYLIGNSTVRLSIEGEAVTLYHSGMVQGSIPRESITGVREVGYKGRSGIVISTSDGLEYNVPIACFSEAEVEEMLRELRKA